MATEPASAHQIAEALPPGRHERWIDAGFAALVTLLLGWLLLPPA